MNEYTLCDDGSGNTAMEYPKSDHNGSVSDASAIPQDGDHLKEGSEEDVERYQIENPKLARALAVVKEYCAIGRESKSAEDGRQALEHTRAARMAIYNVGERDVANVRVILAAFGIFAVDMTDIDAMGIQDPEGHHRHIGDWRSSDGRKKSRAGSHCPVWVFEDQACNRNMIYEKRSAGSLERN
jgi:hypothetical protein